MKIANALMMALLLYCMAVQYNDPDAILWILIYGYGFVLTTMAFFGKYTLLSTFGAVAYFLGFAFVVPGWDWDTLMLLTEPKMDTNDVELAREGFGMFLTGVWMVVLAVAGHLRKAKNELSESPEAAES